MATPLSGIKVLDLTRLAPGPFCTMILGDFGADIIRVQEPGPPTGRRAEQAGMAGTKMVGAGGSAAHNALHRNKRSIGINLKDKEAREIFYQLVKQSDVLVEEMRPGVAKRLGIDYDTLKQMNPRLIYCAVTGYGQTGPYAKLAGHDLNYIAQAGALGLIGAKDGTPVIPQNLIADYAGGGMHGAIGVMMALFAREKTGRGQLVDIAMLDGSMYLITQFLSAYYGSGEIPERGNSFAGGGLPYYNVYTTKDEKHITLGSIEPWFFANLCRSVGREDLIDKQNDKDKHEEIAAFLKETMKTKTRDEWFTRLNETDQCVGKMLGLEELQDDPQVQARNMIVDLERVDGTPVRQVGIGPKLSDTPGSVRDIAPTLGQHTDEILSDLGILKENITHLRESGAVR